MSKSGSVSGSTSVSKSDTRISVKSPGIIGCGSSGGIMMVVGVVVEAVIVAVSAVVAVAVVV